MGWLEALRGKVVGLDTAPVIYYIEKHKSYIGLMHPFFEAVDRGDCSAVTSIVTLLEGLVIPIRNGDVELVRRYHEFLLDTKGLTTSTLFTNIVEGAARLRAFHNIRTPDAIQMATAISMGASVFLTNDKSLPSVPGLEILVLDNLKSVS